MTPLAIVLQGKTEEGPEMTTSHVQPPAPPQQHAPHPHTQLMLAGSQLAGVSVEALAQSLCVCVCVFIIVIVCVCNLRVQYIQFCGHM